MGLGGDLASIVLRGWTFLWTLIALSLVGNAIAIQSNSNSSVNYALFTAIFCMLVLAVWLLHRFMELPGLIMLTADALAALFSLIAGIVLAARLHVHECNNTGYLLTNDLTQGSHKRCRELQASCCFFWFIFLGFALSMFIDFMSKGSAGFRGSRSRGTPAMSQV